MHYLAHVQQFNVKQTLFPYYQTETVSLLFILTTYLDKILNDKKAFQLNFYEASSWFVDALESMLFYFINFIVYY